MKLFDRLETRYFAVPAIAVLLATLIVAGTFPNRHAFAQQVGPGGVPSANSAGTKPASPTGSMQYDNNGSFGGLNGNGIPNLNGSSAPTIATSAQIGAQLSADPADIDVDSINNAYLVTDVASPVPDFYLNGVIPPSLTSGYGNISLDSEGNALSSVTSGNSNLGLGHGTLESDTTGSNNTAVGSAALSRQISGSNNVAIGSGADPGNISGSDNIAIGDTTQAATSGELNIAIGYDAIASSSGQGNTFIGAYAAPVSPGVYSYSTGLGMDAAVTASNQIVLGAAPGTGSPATAHFIAYGAPQFPAEAASSGTSCGQLDTAGNLTGTGSPCLTPAATPQIVASGSASASASVSSFTAYTPTAAGVYQVCAPYIVTSAGSTGATLEAFSGFYTSDVGHQPVLGGSAEAATSVGASGAGYGQYNCVVGLFDANKPITIGYAVGGSPTTNPTYTYWYTVESI